MNDTIASYQLPNLFPEGTIHHAAEVGSLAAMQQIEQQQNQLRGLPALVVLELRDDLLQCVPLHVAAERGHLDVVKHIISHDADLDASDRQQVRPLHLAAINNHMDVVKALTNKGANVTKQDNLGDMPLHWAATKGLVEMLELLLERGAPIDGHNKAGWTALHRAAFNGRVEACRLLLRRGASIHAVTKAGCTPLHLAAANNHLGVMELLLQLGASTYMKNNQGTTPGDMCIGDAARSLLEDKERNLRPDSASHPSSANSQQRPDSSLVSGAAKTAGATDILRAPDMPRFKPVANANLDADGFPTAETHLTHAAALLQDEVSEPQVLLLQGVEAGEQCGDEGITSVISAAVAAAAQGSNMLPATYETSDRPTQLCQQPSQQLATALASSASARFSVGHSSSGIGNLKHQQQPWPVGKKSTGPMQRFLQQYSLDKKGLFAP